jgi:hypothetical protein
VLIVVHYEPRGKVLPPRRRSCARPPTVNDVVALSMIKSPASMLNTARVVTMGTETKGVGRPMGNGVSSRRDIRPVLIQYQ